jgi:Mn-dependent DtxR family transcriptional regulator
MSRACINFDILLDFTLTRKEIALYGIIENMESDGKYVFYNNATLAKMLDVGEESKMVSRMCRNLKNKGYITDPYEAKE